MAHEAPISTVGQDIRWLGPRYSRATGRIWPLFGFGPRGECSRVVVRSAGGGSSSCGDLRRWVATDVECQPEHVRTGGKHHLALSGEPLCEGLTVLGEEFAPALDRSNARFLVSGCYVGIHSTARRSRLRAGSPILLQHRFGTHRLALLTSELGSDPGLLLGNALQPPFHLA